MTRVAGLVLLGLACLAAVARAGVIGVDLGSAFMKVALVQLGVPLEVVPNTISKRKTEVCIAFDREDRLFGSDAFNMLSRKPKNAFAQFTRMIGRGLDHDAVDAVRKMHYAMDLYANATRGGVSLKLGDANYSPEELVAMMLSHAREFTKAFGGKEVRDCVLTVPSFYTVHEREALRSAVRIAGMKLLSLIDENTAAALHYGKDRVFQEKHNVLIFNMGATATQVSIAAFGAYNGTDHGKKKPIGTFDVLAKAWDAHLGGSNFDLLLTELFADRFNAQFGVAGFDVRTVPRAMAKLRAQALKTKHVLSANSEIPVKINGLHDDRDFTTHVTRAEFEAMGVGLFSRVTVPITKALEQAGITMDDVDAVELVGGGMRIPKVQAVLGEFFGAAHPLGVHLNGDEAMAYGAAFRAANLSTSLKARKTGMFDYAPFPVSVQLTSILADVGGGFLGGMFAGKPDPAAEEDARAWNKSTTLFAARSKLDSKKTIAFHHDRDIGCNLTHVVEGLGDFPSHTSPFIAQFNITGVAQFTKDMASKGLGRDKPRIHLTFKLDSSGLVVISKAEATFEEPSADADADADADANASATNATASTGDESAATAAGAGDAEAANATANSTGASGKGKGGSSSKKKSKSKSKVHRVDLTVKKNFALPETLSSSPANVATSIAKLDALALADNARREKEASKNNLESFLYAVRNRIWDNEEVVNSVSTEEQREEVLTMVAEYAEWLDDEGYDVEAAVYNAKQQDVRAKSGPIFLRVDELEARPKAVKAAEKRLSDIRELMRKWTTTMPQVSEAERADVLALVENAEKWVADKKAAQEQVAPHEPPAFLASSIDGQLKSVATLVTKLSRKPKPAPPKKAANVTNTTNTTNSTAGPTNETTPSPSGDDGPESAAPESAPAGDDEL